MILEAINGGACEKAYIESGRDPDHLARFLRAYPAAVYLKWVKTEIAGWIAAGDISALKHGRGQRHISELERVFTDFLIYDAVRKKAVAGHSLVGIFEEMAHRSFAGQYFSWQHIRDRYYRWLNHTPARFVDADGTLIVGPTKIDAPGLITGIGFVIIGK